MKAANYYYVLQTPHKVACECHLKLKKAGISYEEVNPFEEKIESAEEYDLDQGNRIVNPPYITEKMAMRFFSMFWGREDVYARRGKNGGYFPQCANRWNDRLCPKQRKEKVFCDECENTKWISLDVKKIIAHLLGTKEDGSDVIGVYPLLSNGTCRFIVFDFDLSQNTFSLRCLGQSRSFQRFAHCGK